MPLREVISAWPRWLRQAVALGADETDCAGLAASIQEARRDWLCARSHFDFVSDPDLVDHVIYSIDAAEKKYMYLLREARQSGASFLPSPGPRSSGWFRTEANI